MQASAVEPGQRFGRLVVLHEAISHRHPSGCVARRIACRCDCGTELTVFLSAVRSGHTASCGCLQKELAAERRHSEAKHGMEGTPTYRSWCQMKSRCMNPHHMHYRNYGGRGITVCRRWIDSFEAFLEDMGERPSMRYSLDRIDNDGGYEKDNCRWATSKQQRRNARSNRMLSFRGRTLCVAEWAEVTGIKQGAIYDRLGAGWSVEETLTLPVTGRIRS